MDYGIGQKLPNQDPELVRRLSMRWLRAVEPHNKWAKTAKMCTDFLEGRMWTEEEKAELNQIKRTALTINKINPLYRLIMGYQTSNRNDVSYQPTSDSQSSEDVATVLNAMFKAEAGRIDLDSIDSEVFSDGIVTGRGFWDIRLCFEENDFGEAEAYAGDPFATYIDPDANLYNLNKSAAYLQDSVWTDLDRIGEMYGLEAARACQYLMSPNGQTNSNLLSYLGDQDISPARFFGSYADDKAMNSWNDVYYNDFVDHQAKRIRLLDTQYQMKSIKPCFIDLETGTVQPIPDDWLRQENQYKIQAALDHAKQMNNYVEVAPRPVKRIRWTTTCGDVILHDKWSPYKSYTKIGFFPYFRRGVTRGMIEDLIDPSREINKKRSVLVDILNRSANTGWMYEENALDPEQEENLKRFGASPGVNIKWKAGVNQAKLPPQRIEPAGYPQGLDRIEEKNSMDLYQISGVNESALGQLDRVQSGRAIEARQRQAVLAIQMYEDNFFRSKKIQGAKFLELFQNHYTEERIYRTMGEDSKAVIYEINKKIQTGQNAVTRMNDITIGKYSVHVDRIPMSATFKQAQFEETMQILEKLGPIGQALAQTDPMLIIEQTSLPRKNDWKNALMQAASTAAMQSQEVGAPPSTAPATTPEGMPS